MATGFTLDKTKIGAKLGEIVTGLLDGLLLVVTGPLKLLEDWGVNGQWFKDIRTAVDKFAATISGGAGSLIAQFVDWITSLFTGSSTPAPDAPAAPDTKAKDAPKAEETPEPPSPGKVPAKPVLAKGAGR